MAYKYRTQYAYFIAFGLFSKEIEEHGGGVLARLIDRNAELANDVVKFEQAIRDDFQDRYAVNVVMLERDLGL